MPIQALLLKGALGTALALTGAASSGHQASAKVKLALVPLPKSALGPAGSSLSLNQNALLFGGAGTGEYSLDYGYAFSGKTGVSAIETSVGKYASKARARHALGEAKKEEAAIQDAGADGVSATAKAVKVRKIAARQFAELIVLNTPGAATVYELDEEFTDGHYILSATVGAGSASAAKRLAPVLARKIQKRLALALAGRLRGKAPKPPQPPAPGPPSGGPDLSTLVLTADDFGTATVTDQSYQPVSFAALSSYAVEWQPAGQYDAAEQLVDWSGNPNEATWDSALYELVFIALTANDPSQVTPVDLNAVGDGAHGFIVQGTESTGAPAWLALIGLSAGQASDVVLAESPNPLQDADVQNLAQAAANRLDAGLGG